MHSLNVYTLTTITPAKYLLSLRMQVNKISKYARLI